MNCCNLLVWNIRGLNSVARRAVVRAFVRHNAVSMICLQETKMSTFDSSLVSEICGPSFTGFAFSPSEGASGGLLVAWTDDLTVSSTQCSKSFISAKCTNVATGVSWHLINMYGPQAHVDKIAFLAELQLMCLNSADALVILGDFNLIASAADKNNSNIHRGLLNAFRNFINVLELKDMYLHGRRYTWSNEQFNTTLVKLDRVLYNQPWNTAFPNAILQGLSSAASDHCPLLLTCNSDMKP